MQSPKAIAQYGADLGLHPTGTGPFSFVSYVAGQNLVLKRNDAYQWNPPATRAISRPARHRGDHLPDRHQPAGAGQPVPGRAVASDPGRPRGVLERARQDGPVHRPPGADHRHGHLRADQRQRLADQTISQCARRFCMRSIAKGVEQLADAGRLPDQQHAAGQGHDRLRRRPRNRLPVRPGQGRIACSRAPAGPRAASSGRRTASPSRSRSPRSQPRPPTRCWPRRSRATCARPAWTRRSSRWRPRPGWPPTSRATCR